MKIPSNMKIGKKIQRRTVKLIFFRHINVSLKDIAINKEINTINMKSKKQKSYSINRDKRYFTAFRFVFPGLVCLRLNFLQLFPKTYQASSFSLSVTVGIMRARNNINDFPASIGPRSELNSFSRTHRFG